MHVAGDDGLILQRSSLWAIMGLGCVGSRMNNRAPNFALRDLAGLICALFVAAALITAAFVTHAGPFILIAILILLTFGLLRVFRERGREAEIKEVKTALRTRLHKGEQLLAIAVGDRRRVKPLATAADVTLMMFTQGLAAEGSGALAVDDTFVGVTDQRLIAIDRQKRPPGETRGWLERLNLRRRDASEGKHAVIFEASRAGLSLSVRIAVFHLARLNAEATDGRTFSIGLNSRYWANRAVELVDEAQATQSP
jgi:hypothetical protein